MKLYIEATFGVGTRDDPSPTVEQLVLLRDQVTEADCGSNLQGDPKRASVRIQ